MAFWNAWATYSPLPTSSQDATTSGLQPRLLDILKSKRIRLLSAAATIVVLMGYGVFGSGEEISSWRFESSLTPGAPTTGGELTPSAPTTGAESVDWSRFAYTQYVTNTAYLCNSVMLFEILHRLGSKADRLLMYPSTFDANPETTQGKLLLKAQQEYGAKLQPIEVQSRPGGEPTWADSYTKLLAFNQTQYSRVLSLDSDSTILQSMDELFLLPPCPVAMPRAYWMKEAAVLSSQLVLITPSAAEFTRIEARIDSATANEFDMEIVNKLYGASALVIPHRPYNVLTGEFRHLDNHASYLGSNEETWDPRAVLAEAKFLHFSDWPVPKPWLNGTAEMDKQQPPCRAAAEGGVEDCTLRDIWVGFYKDFAKRRKTVCDLDLK